MSPDPTPPTSPAAVSAPLRPVEELQALCDAASPLPWVRHDGAMMHIARVWPNNVAVIATMRDIDAGPMGTRSSANRDLIVAAVNALPSLLARLRAAEETLAAVGSAIDRIPRRSGTPEWSTAASVAQASGYDVGLAVASDAVRAVLAEGASR